MHRVYQDLGFNKQGESFMFAIESPLTIMPIHTSLLALLILAVPLSTVLAQSPSAFPPHCLPRISSNPYLDPQSCAIAINHFESDNQNTTGVMTTEAAAPGEVQLPWDRTNRNCRLRVELLYANKVEQSTHNVWSQGNRLNTECMIKANFVGGMIIVDDAGLAVSFRPAGDDNGWEGRFGAESVVVDAGSTSIQNPGLTEVTGSAGRRARR